MQSSDILETALWCIAALLAGGMLVVIALGLFKGVFWEQQLKTRKRNS